MTEGEKMIWAAAYVAELQKSGDPFASAKYASGTLIDLRQLKNTQANPLLRAMLEPKTVVHIV